MLALGGEENLACFPAATAQLPQDSHLLHSACLKETRLTIPSPGKDFLPTDLVIYRYLFFLKLTVLIQE